MSDGQREGLPARHVREKAVALQYQDLGELPKVTASGVGQLAREIIALAEKHGIPVRPDRALAEMLSALRVGDAVTPESFRLVAELISFLYQADQAWRREHGFLDPVLGESLSAPESPCAQTPSGLPPSPPPAR